MCPISIPLTSALSLKLFLSDYNSPVSLHLKCSHVSFFSFSAPLAKPKNSASVVTVQAGSKSVVVAQCEAADGKPAATIKWMPLFGGNHSTTTTNGPDGTVTVRSEYRLVPTPADNDRELTCMVDQRTQERQWVYPLRLSVECKEENTHTRLTFSL